MNSETKSKIGSVIGTGVLAITCLVVGFVACQMMPKSGPMAGQKADPRKMVAQVAITNGEMRAWNLAEEFVAHVEAMAEVDLRPQVDGYIKEILFKEGDIVREGQLLYTLDDEKYQAIVGQAKADLAAAEAESNRASQYVKRLESADNRGITQLERDNAVADAEKGKASVMQAKANLVVAEYNCKKAKVVAPISGKIGKTAAHVGDLVSPSGPALAHIIQIDPIRVTFPMTDTEFIEVMRTKKSGKLNDLRLRLLLPGGEEYDKQGEMDFDDNEMSKETATMTMRLKFPNPDRLLVPNAYVTLLTDDREPKKYLSVPQQCIVNLSGGALGVWVVGADGTVNPRPVKTKEAYLGWTPITAGLKADERVVLSGVGKLMAGQKVVAAQPTPNDDIKPGHKNRATAE